MRADPDRHGDCFRFIEESDGAKVMFVEADTVPLMVVKSDGGYGYDSTDLAAIEHRCDILDRSLHVCGSLSD